MPREEVKCKLCDSLYPREWLSEHQQKHWDEVAKGRGITAGAQDPAAANPEDQMELDIEQMDKDGAGDGLQAGEVQRSHDELQEDLKAAEQEHAYVSKLDGIDDSAHGTMCNLLLGKANRLKERIQAAESNEPPSTSDEARKLNKELNQVLATQKSEKERGDKWDAKVVQLEKEASEARAHARVCRANEEEHQAKVQSISQKLAQLTSAQPPAAETDEQQQQPDAEAARLNEMQAIIDGALQQQRDAMVAEFQKAWAAQMGQLQAAQQQPPAAPAGGTVQAAPPPEAPKADEDLVKKMGENFKKQSAGLASKAAASAISSVKSSITKDKGKDKKKEEAKKLSGKAAEATAESEALAARTEEQLRAA